MVVIDGKNSTSSGRGGLCPGRESCGSVSSISLLIPPIPCRLGGMNNPPGFSEGMMK